MLRGTRFLFGKDAVQFRDTTEIIREKLSEASYIEFIPSALSEAQIFTDKAGPEVLKQMYDFQDKKGRDICLVPEITAVVQNIYKNGWEQSMPKPVKLFYLARCYRYERPQEGRYREFWQLGVENLGGKTTGEEMIQLLDTCLKSVGLKEYEIKNEVKRGLDYYVEDGFEVEVPILGAQKQVAGGGRYDCGIGWAIGIDRLILALNK